MSFGTLKLIKHHENPDGMAENIIEILKNGK